MAVAITSLVQDRDTGTVTYSVELGGKTVAVEASFLAAVTLLDVAAVGETCRG